MGYSKILPRQQMLPMRDICGMKMMTKPIGTGQMSWNGHNVSAKETLRLPEQMRPGQNWAHGDAISTGQRGGEGSLTCGSRGGCRLDGPWKWRRQEWFTPLMLMTGHTRVPIARSTTQGIQSKVFIEGRAAKHHVHRWFNSAYTTAAVPSRRGDQSPRGWSLASCILAVVHHHHHQLCCEELVLTWT